MNIIASVKTWSRPAIAGVIGAILLVFYVGLALAFSGQIPSGTTISGVNVAGMSQDQARGALEKELGPQLATPRAIVVKDIEHDPLTIDPAVAKIAIDYDATLSGLTGFSLNPVHLWRHIVGGSAMDAQLTADKKSLDEQLTALAGQVERAGEDASITFEGSTPVVKASNNARKLDVSKSRAVLLQSWFFGKEPLTLPSVESPAHITTKEAQEFVDNTLTPLLAQPVSVDVKEKHIELNPEQLADLLVIEHKEHFLVNVNPEKLRSQVDTAHPDLLTHAKDAVISIKNADVSIAPSQEGEQIDADDFAHKLGHVVETKNRTITAKIDVSQPTLTTKAAEELGIKEVVSEISTPITSDSVRTENLIVGSQYVSNTLVKPGETFDLQTALGPLEESRGFRSSGVFVNGFSSKALGGGLSQLATNVFNVGYRAGLEDLAHTPHSVYYDRYPMGLESTIWYDKIFVKWKNTTPYGVMIQSFVSGGKLTTRLWSTKHFNVEVHQGQPYGYVKAETKENPAPDCSPSSYTKDGFSVDVGRTVTLQGKPVEDSRHTVHYDPIHAVTCPHKEPHE